MMAATRTAAGLRHPNSQALKEACHVLRDLMDIDGDLPPEDAA